MCLPSLSPSARRAAIAAWQLFPLWTGLAQRLLAALLSRRATPPPAATLAALRRTYGFALIVAGASHLLVVGTVLLHGRLGPLIPSAFDAREPLDVLVPVSPFSRARVEGLPEGVLGLLQYDTIFAGLGALVWMAHLYGRTVRGVSRWGMLVRGVVGVVLVGPCGAAVALAWGRDEVVFKEGEEGKGKKGL